MVADLGDVNINLYNLQDSCRLIREAYRKIVAADCIPLTLGNGIRKGKGRSLPSGFSNAGPSTATSPGQATVTVETEG